MLNPRFVVRNVLRYGRLIIMESGMTKEELLELLKRPEGGDVEFKKAQNSVSHDAYKTVSAFANTNGGWLIFGISDKGMPHEIIGIESSNIDKVQGDFFSARNDRHKLSVQIEAELSDFEIDGKWVLAFHIPEAQRHDKPVHLNHKLSESYYRRGGSDERMSSQQLKRFIRDSDIVPWDNKVYKDADLETGIDADTLDWYMG